MRVVPIYLLQREVLSTSRPRLLVRLLDPADEDVDACALLQRLGAANFALAEDVVDHELPELEGVALLSGRGPARRSRSRSLSASLVVWLCGTKSGSRGRKECEGGVTERDFMKPDTGG